MSVMNESQEEPQECPLCMEPFEADDVHFYPCTCGYQICRFCWHRIRNDDQNGGLCPACRKAYSEDPAAYKPMSQEQMAEMKARKKARDQQRKAKLSESRKHLASVRVVQKNLVFVVGLPMRLADAEVLKRHEYFGKFGKIHKVVINQSTTYAGSQGPSASAYVTYMKSDDALRAIEAVNNVAIDGRVIKSSLGTTKYCSHFMKNQTCPKPDCMYLHDFGDPEASFTKEQMHLGRHTEYEKKLHDSLQQRTLAAAKAEASGASGAGGNNGGGNGNSTGSEQQQKTVNNNTAKSKESGGGNNTVQHQQQQQQQQQSKDGWPQLDKSDITGVTPTKDTKTKDKEKRNKTKSTGTGGRGNEKSKDHSISSSSSSSSTSSSSSSIGHSKKSENFAKISPPPTTTTTTAAAATVEDSSSIIINQQQQASKEEFTEIKKIVDDSSDKVLKQKLHSTKVSAAAAMVDDDNSSFFSHNTFQNSKLMPQQHQDDHHHHTEINSRQDDSIFANLLSNINIGEDWAATFGYRGSENRNQQTVPQHNFESVTDLGLMDMAKVQESFLACTGVKPASYDGMGSNTSKFFVDYQNGQQQQQQQQQHSQHKLDGLYSSIGAASTAGSNGAYPFNPQQTQQCLEQFLTQEKLQLLQHQKQQRMNLELKHSSYYANNFLNGGVGTDLNGGGVVGGGGQQQQQQHHQVAPPLPSQQPRNGFVGTGVGPGPFGLHASFHHQQQQSPQQQQQGLTNHHSNLHHQAQSGIQSQIGNSLHSNSSSSSRSNHQQQHVVAEDELDFDPIKETQKAFAELMGSEAGKTNTSTVRNSMSNGVLQNHSGNGHLPPPPGFVQQSTSTTHMNSFGSKILPFLNMSNSQQISSNHTQNWSGYNTVQQQQQQQQHKTLPAMNSFNDWKEIDSAIVTAARHCPPPPLRDHFSNALQHLGSSMVGGLGSAQLNGGTSSAFSSSTIPPPTTAAHRSTSDYSSNAFSNFAQQLQQQQHQQQQQQQTQQQQPNYFTTAFANQQQSNNLNTWFGTTTELNGQTTTQISSPPGFRNSAQQTATKQQQEC